MSDGRVRPRVATIAVSALIALSGAAQWQALYAEARNAPAKRAVSTTLGCVQNAQGVSAIQSMKEPSGSCARDTGK